MNLENIRSAAENAWAKVGYSPDRIHELCDDDLDALERATATMRPMAEAALVEMVGGVEPANALLGKLKGFTQARMIKLVHAAKRASRLRHIPTQYQMAALVIDVQVGCNFIAVERERREAVRSHAMN